MATDRTPPPVVLDGLLRSHADLVGHLERSLTDGTLNDRVAAAPAALPGWSRGHVLTHLARNAESVTRAWDGARQGRVEVRYPGGSTQRNGEIDAGAGRPAVELVADVRTSIERLEASLAAMEPAHWSGWCQAVGRDQPVADLVVLRWREVEVHRLDLDLGHRIDDWPDEFVRRDPALPPGAVPPQGRPIGTAERAALADALGRPS